MATTGAPANIPLFDDNSPITPIQTPLNSMATALNNYLKQNDTGWVNLTLPSGFAAHSGRTPAIRRYRGAIYLRGGITTSDGSAMSNTSQIIANLPSGFRGPASQNWYFLAMNGFTGSPGVVTVGSGGSALGYQPNATNTTYVYLSGLTWLED